MLHANRAATGLAVASLTALGGCSDLTLEPTQEPARMEGLDAHARAAEMRICRR